MDDQILLARYAATQDASAFEELTKRHVGMVKSVCVRVLGNSHDAEEVTQECFLELARHAGRVHSSIVGWLHRAATSRSLNVIRSRKRRKVREREVGCDAESAAPSTEVTTRELYGVIDGALTELPEDLRLPMILHYFDGRSQRDVALELGVNQSTISRRMHDALQQMREKLTQAGYVTTAPALMALMQNQSVMAASDSVLTKVVVSDTVGRAAGSATLFGSVKAAVAAAVPIICFLVVGGWVSLVVASCVTIYVARYRPNWVADLFASLGLPDVYSQPTYCLSRWNWNHAPTGWRMEVLSSLASSVLYCLLSLAFAFGTHQTPWGTVILGVVVASGLMIHALRILHRVYSIRTFGLADQTELASAERPNRVGIWDQFVGFSPDDSTLSWFDAVQLTGMGLAGVGITIQMLFFQQTNREWPSVILAGTIGSGMLLSGIWLWRQLARVSTNRRQAEEFLSESKSRPWGTRTVLAGGVAIVTALSFWIVWNPSAVRGLSMSLAALQTSMLGWIVYRLAAHCRSMELGFVRRMALIVLASCFVLNSGVCLANWWR